MEQIAKRAGVTRATVSNVLNGRLAAERSDAAERARRIRQIAEEMGYRPSVLARAQRTKRTGCIGMLSAHHPAFSVHFGGFDRALIQALSKRGLLLVSDLLNPPTSDGEDDPPLPRIVAESLADGFLINYAYAIPPNVQRMIDQHRLAAVWINADQPDNTVRPDDAGASIQAVRHLVEQGHRRIAYVQPCIAPADRPEHYSTAEREAGYRTAMAEAGLEALVIKGDAPKYSGAAVAQAAANSGLDRSLVREATAVIYNGEATTLLTLAAQRGIRLPDDLSLICFENSSGPYEQEYARLVVPMRQAAEEAVAMLCSALDDKPGPREPVLVRYGVSGGGTVGRPRGR